MIKLVKFIYNLYFKINFKIYKYLISNPENKILFGKFLIRGKFNFLTKTFIDCILPISNSFKVLSSNYNSVNQVLFSLYRSNSFDSFSHRGPPTI